MSEQLLKRLTIALAEREALRDRLDEQDMLLDGALLDMESCLIGGTQERLDVCIRTFEEVCESVRDLLDAFEQSGNGLVFPLSRDPEVQNTLQAWNILSRQMKDTLAGIRNRVRFGILALPDSWRDQINPTMSALMPRTNA